MIIIWKKSNKS